MGVPGDPTPNPIFLPPAFVKEICVYIYIYSCKKKNKKSSVLVCGCGFFCVKCCTVALHNAMARICLETNSSEDVLLEKAPFLQ